MLSSESILFMRGLTARIILSSLISLIWFHTPVTKAHGVQYQVCASQIQCSATDIACNAAKTAAEAACDTKINAYNLYMAGMGHNVSTHALPSVHRDILRVHYPQSNLNAVRFGFSTNQPPNNTTTDCSTVYSSVTGFVDRVRNGSALSLPTSASRGEWFLLLHELTHTEQCVAVGGRAAYAKMWWDQLEVALAAQGRKVNFVQPPQDLANQMATLYAQGHDMMPMEAQANAKANNVMASLQACCISQNGTPIRPLTLTGIDERPDAGSSRRILTAKIAGGDGQLAFRWWIRSPGDAAPVLQSASLMRNAELLWMPNHNPANARVVSSQFEQRRIWDHEIRVEVTQSVPQQVLQTARTISISERVFVNMPKSGPQIDKLPKELPPPQKQFGGLPDPMPSKQGSAPGTSPTKQ